MEVTGFDFVYVLSPVALVCRAWEPREGRHHQGYLLEAPDTGRGRGR